MNHLTKNEVIALQHLSDGKQHDDIPKDITAAQYFTALKSLKARGFVRAAFIEGGESECAQITMEGKAALDDLKQEKQKQNVVFGDVSDDARQRYIKKMEALVELINEEEYLVLKFLYDTKAVKRDFTNEVPEGMYQPQYEKICDALKEKDLVDIIKYNIRGYYVISTIEGDDLVEFISRNDTKFNKINFSKDKGITSSAYHDKVRLELTLKLLEHSGINLAIHGNKAKAASVLQSITDLPLSTCKNYCTNRDLSHETHSSEISDINSELEKLGVIFRI